MRLFSKLSNMTLTSCTKPQQPSHQNKMLVLYVSENHWSRLEKEGMLMAWRPFISPSVSVKPCHVFNGTLGHFPSVLQFNSGVSKSKIFSWTSPSVACLNPTRHEARHCQNIQLMRFIIRCQVSRYLVLQKRTSPRIIMEIGFVHFRRAETVRQPL